MTIIFIPSGLSRIHSGLEPSLKSIDAALAKSAKSVAAIKQTNTAALAAQIASLQKQVTALTAEDSDESYVGAEFIPANMALIESMPGLAAIADNTEISTAAAVIGISGAQSGVGAPVTLIGPGETATFSGWDWTVGLPIYVGADGALTQVEPSSNPVMVGVAVTPTSILVMPQQIFASASGIPILVASGVDYSVPTNTQVVFDTEIYVEAGGTVETVGTGSLSFVK